MVHHFDIHRPDWMFDLDEALRQQQIRDGILKEQELEEKIYEAKNHEDQHNEIFAENVGYDLDQSEKNHQEHLKKSKKKIDIRESNSSSSSVVIKTKIQIGVSIS